MSRLLLIELNDLANFSGFWWLLLLLGPLLFFQHRLQFEVQGIFLLITRRQDLAITLFSVIFFPGVVLHESSHYIMARILGVPTGKISLIPQTLDGGKLRMGYVETAQTDWLRDTLIGLAPLMTGCAAVAYIGLVQLGLDELWRIGITEGGMSFVQAVVSIMDQPDFWLWIFLAFTISSTMFPSESDRRAWLPLGMLLLGVFLLSLISGAGPWMYDNLLSPFNQALLAVDAVLGITLFIHVLLFVPLIVIRLLLSRLTGLKVRAG